MISSESWIVREFEDAVAWTFFYLGFCLGLSNQRDQNNKIARFDDQSLNRCFSITWPYVTRGKGQKSRTILSAFAIYCSWQCLKVKYFKYFYIIRSTSKRSIMSEIWKKYFRRKVLSKSTSMQSISKRSLMSWVWIHDVVQSNHI